MYWLKATLGFVGSSSFEPESVIVNVEIWESGHHVVVAIVTHQAVNIMFDDC